VSHVDVAGLKAKKENDVKDKKAAAAKKDTKKDTKGIYQIYFAILQKHY